jgi:HK97 family phage prohead protease
MPRPSKGEDQDSFVQRYMSSEEAQRKYPDQKQRLAIAFSLYKNKDRKRKKRTKQSTHEMKGYYPDYCEAGICYKLASGIHAVDNSKDDVVDFDESEMSCTAIFASERRDRQGDVLQIAGIDTSEHKITPCILLDHALSHPLPIGVARTPEGEYTVVLDEQKGIATQKTYFAQNDRVAEQCYSLIRSGILSANSIGFRPIRWKRLAQDWSQGEQKSNKKIESCELVEVSFVAVPANPDCQVLYEKDSIEGKSLAPCIKSMLGRYTLPRNNSWSSGVTLGDSSVSISTPTIETKAIDTPQSWVNESLGAPLVDQPPTVDTTKLTGKKPGGSTELKDKSQESDFGIQVPGVFISNHGSGKYKVLMRTAAGDLQENMITGKGQAEQYGQRLANEHELPVYFELDIAVLGKKSLNGCGCADKSNCTCNKKHEPDTIEGTVDEVIDMAHTLIDKAKTERKNMSATISKKSQMNGNSPKVSNKVDDGTVKVEQGKEAGPQGGVVKPQKPKSVKRTPIHDASENKEEPKFNGTDKPEFGEEAGPEGGQDVKAMEDEETKGMSEAEEGADAGPEGGESGRNVDGNPEEEHEEFMETATPDEETKDDLENWDEDIAQGQEPLSAETLRDLHADLQKVHKVYSESTVMMEHPNIKTYIQKFLDAMMSTVDEIEQIFSKEHPDQSPLTKIDDGAEPDMDMENMDEEEPAGEEEVEDIDAEVKEPGGPMEEVEESIEEPEDVPPGDKSYRNGSIKAYSQGDRKRLEEIKDFLDDLANQEVAAPSKRKAATAVLKYCSSEIKAMMERGQKPVKIHPSKAGVTVKAAGQAPEGSTENKEQALETKVKKGSQDASPEDMSDTEQKHLLSVIDNMERKLKRQKYQLNIA